MVYEAVLCPFCQQPHAVYRHGKVTADCRCTACRRAFQLHYCQKIHKLGTRAHITELALNRSCIHNPARVLGISPQTVMSELKKDRPAHPTLTGTARLRV